MAEYGAMTFIVGKNTNCQMDNRRNVMQRVIIHVALHMEYVDINGKIVIAMNASTLEKPKVKQ